jgi:hypothetical protein
MAKSKKSSPKVMAAKDPMPTYKPSIHLDDEDDMPDAKVGDMVKMTAHGKVVSHSVNEDEEGGTRKSMRVELHKMSFDGGDDDGEGMVPNPAAKGAKSAVDGALSQMKKGEKKKPSKK